MRIVSMFRCVCVILVSSMIPSLLSIAFVLFALLSLVLSFSGAVYVSLYFISLSVVFLCSFLCFFVSPSLSLSLLPCFLLVFLVAVCDLFIELSLPVFICD